MAPLPAVRSGSTAEAVLGDRENDRHPNDRHPNDRHRPTIDAAMATRQITEALIG
ncbi:hypothetical protein SAVIM338S_00432 [Streptomyces avidinii]